MKAGRIGLGDLGNGEHKKPAPAEEIPNTVTAADIEMRLHERRARRARRARFPARRDPDGTPRG